MAWTFAANPSASTTTQCSDDDRDYAERLGAYYDPDDAVRMGLQIQEIIRAKDTLALFSHVDGERVLPRSSGHFKEAR